MFNFRDPKTSPVGIVLIVIGIIAWLFGVGFIELFEAVASFNVEALSQVLIPFLTGIGLLSAKDNNVST